VVAFTASRDRSSHAWGGISMHQQRASSAYARHPTLARPVALSKVRRAGIFSQKQEYLASTWWTSLPAQSTLRAVPASRFLSGPAII